MNFSKKKNLDTLLPEIKFFNAEKETENSMFSHQGTTTLRLKFFNFYNLLLRIYEFYDSIMA
jgi:hypothetical protein